MTVSLLTACGNNFDERLKDEAEQLTKKHCPQQVDDITTLDSVVYDMERRTYVRYFTLAADAVPVAKENRLAVKATLTDELKNDVSWKTRQGRKNQFRIRLPRCQQRHSGFHHTSGTRRLSGSPVKTFPEPRATEYAQSHSSYEKINSQ